MAFIIKMISIPVTEYERWQRAIVAGRKLADAVDRLQISRFVSVTQTAVVDALHAFRQADQ